MQVSSGKHVRPGGRRHFRRQNCFSSRTPETLSPADTDCPPLPAPGAQGAALRLHGSDSSGPRERAGACVCAARGLISLGTASSGRACAAACVGTPLLFKAESVHCTYLPRFVSAPPSSMDTWVASSFRFCSQCCCERGCVHLFLSLHGVARSRGLSL